MTQNPSRTWLDWAREIQAIAQIGLTYAEIPYDHERYDKLHALAVEIFGSYTGEDAVAIRTALTTQPGYTTPKVDVRGACFRAGKVLLVRERADGRWCLPGGWADVGDVPSQAAEREVLEEAGFACAARKLAGVFDANRAGEPLSAYHAFKLVFLCEITGGASQSPFSGNHETLEVGFFGPDEIPPLSEARTNRAVLAECFAHLADAARAAYFD